AIVLMTFLGGRATLWGPILGAFILEAGQQYLAYEIGGAEFYLIGYAMMFLIIMLFLPRGILPSVAERCRNRARRSVGRTTLGAQTPSPTPLTEAQSSSTRPGSDGSDGLDARSAEARS